MSSFSFDYEIEAIGLRLSCVANFSKGGGEWEIDSVELDMLNAGDPIGDCIEQKIAEQIKQPYLQGLLKAHAEELAANDISLLDTRDFDRTED